MLLNGNKYDGNIGESDSADTREGDDVYMMMAGDDPAAYFLPAAPETASLVDDDDDSDEDEDDYRRPSSFGHHHQHPAGAVLSSNSTNQMLDVVSNKQRQQQQQRKGNRRQQQQQQNNRNRHRNGQNQNDGTSFDDGNPINVISAFNRTGKIYNKLRKNDAVKVVDTPSGRAGFVYQSSSNSGSSSSSSNQDSSNRESGGWDDSQYSHQNQFVNRNANDVKLIPSSPGAAADDANNKKILPVLTKDGKIALVVRGDTSRHFDESQNNGSGNSVNSKKYEPITNLTSIITALNSNSDNNNNNNNNNAKQNDSISAVESPELHSIQEQNRRINRLDEFLASVTNKVKHIEEEIEHKLGLDLGENESDEGGQHEADDDGFPDAVVTSPTTTTTTASSLGAESFGDDDRKDTLLINRPLSEVLGLPKKTHYHYPHDPLHPIGSTSEVPHSGHGRHPPENPRSRFETSIHHPPTTTTTTTDASQAEEFDLESPEKINIAVIPRFDSELEERLFGKGGRDASTNRNLNEISQTSGGAVSSSLHGAIQAMISIACACAVFGVVGTFYRIELVNHIRVIYW